MGDGSTVLSGLIGDLRRRKVFRVAAGYAIVAWVAVEVSSVVLPALRLPEWGVTAVVIAALVGFPVTVLLAWVFDISSDGVVRTEPSGGGDPRALRVAAQRGAVVILAAAVLAGAGYLAWDEGLLGGAPKEQSIAVLPFVDLSEGHDNEYFSDGITEELLNSLVELEGLRVAARTSSFAFKGRQEDVREIGRQLNVNTVLEGSVRRAGNRVRITAQLIDVDNGFHLWSSTYDRELDDIFRIQDEIAQNIAGALKLELIGEAGAQRVAGGVDIRAYDLYLLGRHHWHERTPDSLTRAFDLFEQAAALDPDFALAHTGIADAWILLAGYGDVDPDEAAGRAEAAVARALSLDDKSSEAYASLGLLRLHQRELVAAELALRGAIQLNPNNSMAHMWLGLVLHATQGPLAALAEYERAHEIDPLHPVITLNLAGAMAARGDYALAVEELEAAVAGAAGDEDSSRFLIALAAMHTEWDRFDRAAVAAARSMSVAPEDRNAPIILAAAYVGVGEFRRAEDMLARMGDSGDGKLADFVTEQRMSIALARGDLESLDAQSSEILSGLDDPASLAPQERYRLVVPGVARLISGAHTEGAQLLMLVAGRDAEADVPPPGRVRLLGLAAWGFDQAGDRRGAEAMEQARAVAEDARAQGWNTPGLLVAEAYLELVRGRREAALSRFEEALGLGWAGYYQLVAHPATAPLLQDEDFAGLAGRLKERVEGMRTATVEAGRPSERVAGVGATGS